MVASGEEKNKIREGYIGLQSIMLSFSQWLVGSWVLFIHFMVKIKLKTSRSRIKSFLLNSSVGRLEIPVCRKKEHAYQNQKSITLVLRNCINPENTQ